MITKLDRGAIQDLTDKLLSARQSNLKMVLDIGHRLETLGIVGQVEYINDAKSTTVNATALSLKCMDRPVVWLLSCMQHQQDIMALHAMVKTKVHSIIYLGNDSDSFVGEFVHDVDQIIRCETMEEMLLEAKHVARPGDAVLYSPASPTALPFVGYADRGSVFTGAFKTVV